jgi:hypothetical protein
MPADAGADTLDLISAFEALLCLNWEAFTAGHYEVACLALQTAAQCAQDLADEARLAEVARLARNQGGWIDRHAPWHRIRSRQPAPSSTTAYESLVRGTEAMLDRLRRAEVHGAAGPWEGELG